LVLVAVSVMFLVHAYWLVADKLIVVNGTVLAPVVKYYTISINLSKLPSGTLVNINETASLEIRNVGQLGLVPTVLTSISRVGSGIAFACLNATVGLDKICITYSGKSLTAHYGYCRFSEKIINGTVDLSCIIVPELVSVLPSGNYTVNISGVVATSYVRNNVTISIVIYLGLEQPKLLKNISVSRS